MASKRGKQVVDLKDPLPRSGYPIEVFHYSWLRHLFGRSILFGRGIHPAEVPLISFEAFAWVAESLEIEELLVVVGRFALVAVVILKLRRFCCEVSVGAMYAQLEA